MAEHDEQRALFEWAAWMEGQLPELALLYAIPNGGQRHKAVAAKLKAEGVKAGVPDCFLPVARRGKYGLYIELKFGNNYPSAAQNHWLDALQRQGYETTIAYSWQAAARKLVEYLGRKSEEFGL